MRLKPDATSLGPTHTRRAFGPSGMALAVMMVWAAGATGSSQGKADSRLQERLDEASRREAQVLVELADDAMAGRVPVPDFGMAWRHDFLKADPGTFVPFTVTIEAPGVSASQGLMYVRAARRVETAARGAASQRKRGDFERFAFDAIFPVELAAQPGQPVRISRGFAVPPGEYDVYVAVRERPADPLQPGAARLKMAVLRQALAVPDFWNGKLATSTVMLATRIDALPAPLGPDEALERPYVIGQNDVRVALDSTFRANEELIVVFVIYNPAMTPARAFDVQVDYHLFRRGQAAPGSAAPPEGAPPPREGEQYVTRTNPQRFNPAVLGPRVDPAAGHPIMAGQGILLSEFEQGEYRLAITVTDLVSRTSLSRDAAFRVGGSE